MFLTPQSPSQHQLARHPAKDHPASDANQLRPLAVPSSVRNMATPHRGLEQGLPPGMILPDPLRPPPPQSTPQVQPRPAPHDPVRAASQQNHERDEYNRQIRLEELKAQQEGDKRRQEELRVRQEELRLELRRLEQDMFREAVAKGVPPHLVPLMFTGPGGLVHSNGAPMEIAQQYSAQLQQANGQISGQIGTSLETRREFRAPSQFVYPAGQVSPATIYPSPAYKSPQTHSRTQPRFAPAVNAGPSTLPRLTTNEAQVQPSSAGMNTAADRRSASPSGIYFHHWQPPLQGRDSTKTSPQNKTQLSEDSSPRKRKVAGNVSPAMSSASISSKRRERRRSSITSMAVMESKSSRTGSPFTSLNPPGELRRPDS